MAPVSHSSTENPLQEPQEFSIVLGGPLYQLLRRAHLSDDALTLQYRRVIVISLLAWLPLLVLSAFEKRLLAGAAIPFLKDVEVHTKFLLVVPLLVGAELVVHRRMRFVVRQFLERRLVPENAMARFNDAIASAYRLRGSALAELLLIAFVYIVGIAIVWRRYTSLEAATWFATPSAAGARLSLAGMWYGYVSLPFFQFLLCRWYFRLFIWARFLWKASRIQMSLIPTHPDGNAGIGFLANTVYAFSLLAVAHGALLAGFIAGRIFHLGARLLDFRIEIAVVLGFMLCVIIGPLLLFAPQLAHAKRTGAREYGTLAQRYVRDFDTKWLRGGALSSEPLLGSADIQSLADMNNSFDIIYQMRIAPVTKEAVVQLAVATLAPVAPLVLTMMPLSELAQKLFHVLA